MMTAEDAAKAPAPRGTSRMRGGRQVPSIHPDAETHAALHRVRHSLSSPEVKATLADAVREVVAYYRKTHKGAKTHGVEGGSAAETVFVDPEDYDYLLLTVAPAILRTERRPSSLIEATRVVVRHYMDQHPDLKGE